MLKSSSSPDDKVKKDSADRLYPGSHQQRSRYLDPAQCESDERTEIESEPACDT